MTPNATLRLATTLALLGLPAPLLAQDAPAGMTLEQYTELVGAIDPAKHLVDGEAFLRLRAEGAVVIDLRSRAQYDQGHLPGALHLDSAEITAEGLAALIPSPEQPVLLYCSNALIPTRMIALTDIALPQLLAHGYTQVYVPGFLTLAPLLQDGRLEMVVD